MPFDNIALVVRVAYKSIAWLVVIALGLGLPNHHVPMILLGFLGGLVVLGLRAKYLAYEGPEAFNEAFGHWCLRNERRVREDLKNLAGFVFVMAAMYTIWTIYMVLEGYWSPPWTALNLVALTSFMTWGFSVFGGRYLTRLRTRFNKAATARH